MIINCDWIVVAPRFACTLPITIEDGLDRNVANGRSVGGRRVCAGFGGSGLGIFCAIRGMNQFFSKTNILPHPGCQNRQFNEAGIRVLFK